MNLPDDLKFTPAEAVEAITRLPGFRVAESEKLAAVHYAGPVADYLNALLAERLGEVREVRKNTRRTSMWRLKAYPEDTHTAYLVGVREL